MERRYAHLIPYSSKHRDNIYTFYFREYRQLNLCMITSQRILQMEMALELMEPVARTRNIRVCNDIYVQRCLRIQDVQLLLNLFCAGLQGCNRINDTREVHLLVQHLRISVLFGCSNSDSNRAVAGRNLWCRKAT